MRVGTQKEETPDKEGLSPIAGCDQGFDGLYPRVPTRGYVAAQPTAVRTLLSRRSGAD